MHGDALMRYRTIHNYIGVREYLHIITCILTLSASKAKFCEVYFVYDHFLDSGKVALYPV